MKIATLALLSMLVLGLAPAAQAADGAALFKANCTSCHGERGTSDTPVGKAMNIPPIAGKPAPEVAAHVAEAENHKAVNGKLSNEEREAIAAFVSGIE